MFWRFLRICSFPSIPKSASAICFRNPNLRGFLSSRPPEAQGDRERGSRDARIAGSTDGANLDWMVAPCQENVCMSMLAAFPPPPPWECWPAFPGGGEGGGQPQLHIWNALCPHVSKIKGFCLLQSQCSIFLHCHREIQNLDFNMVRWILDPRLLGGCRSNLGCFTAHLKFNCYCKHPLWQQIAQSACSPPVYRGGM